MPKPHWIQPKNVDMPIVGRVYRHFKGTRYRVKEITMDAETLGVRVTYVAAEHDRQEIPWDRPLIGRNEKGVLYGWGDYDTANSTYRFTLEAEDGPAS